MKIKITPKEEITTGYWFAKKILRTMPGKGVWLIIYIDAIPSGNKAFFTVFGNEYLPHIYEIVDFSEWEFGPRIEFPPND